jgi:hypothetical protein
MELGAKKYGFVEILQSHFILTMSRWSSGLTICFPSQGTRVLIPWGSNYVKPGFSCRRCLATLGTQTLLINSVASSEAGFIPGGLHPEPSLGPRADNVIIPLDLTQLFCPGFTLVAGLPSDGVGCWGGCRACNLTSYSPSLSGPVD